MIWQGAQTVENHIIAERYVALPCYHGAWRGTCGTFKAMDERNVVLSDTLTKLWLLFEKRREVKACLSLSGPSPDGTRVAKLESALETTKLELQTLHGPASESALLHT